eukprot:UN13798
MSNTFDSFFLVQILVFCTGKLSTFNEVAVIPIFIVQKNKAPDRSFTPVGYDSDRFKNTTPASRAETKSCPTLILNPAGFLLKFINSRLNSSFHLS